MTSGEAGTRAGTRAGGPGERGGRGPEALALEAIPGRVAVLDAGGTILRVSRSWREAPGGETTLVGPSFPEGCHYPSALAAVGTGGAERLGERVRGVLGGSSLEPEPLLHHAHTDDDVRWLRTRVRPVPPSDGGGAVVIQFDVTEDLLRQRRLAERDELFRQLVDNIEEIFFVTGPRGREIHYVSPAFQRLLGVPVESLEGRDAWAEFVPPEDRERVLRAGEEGSFPIEHRVLTAEGEERWVRTSVYPVEGPSGAVSRLVGVVTDITPQKRARDQALSSREELREVLTRIPVGVVIHQEGRILYANSAVASYVGYEDAAELWGENFFDFLDPGQRDEARRRVATMSETGEPNPPVEFRARTRAGGWASLHAVPVRVIRFEGRPAHLLLVWDVTHTREMEAALREKEARHQTIVDSSAMGILLLDRQRRVMEANPAVSRLLGWAEDEGRDVVLSNLLHPESAGVWVHCWNELLERKVDRFDQEARIQRSDGSYTWVRTHVSGITDEGGRITHAVVLVEDIAEQKRLEEQLRLAQRIESIGRLAGGVAHDFNNLITVIGGHTDILLSEARLGEEDREELVEIQKAADRAAALTRQLLAFSRKQVLQARVVDLNDVVRGLEGMLPRIIGEDVELVFDLAGDLGPVKADPSQMEQVILNMVVNARDAMPTGGRLTVSTLGLDFDKEFVRSHPGADLGPHVGVRVADTGEGMSADTLSRIFEPFYTTKEPGRGTGLGLAMAYGIVKQSDGYIDVDSRPGEGSVFSVWLPVTEEETPAEPPKEAPGGESGTGTETILLVEDEPMVRKLSEKVLASRGYRVIPAADAIEALAALEEHPGEVHLLLTDVVMPRIGGRELAERVVRHRPGTRVLYISGYTDDAIVRHGVLDRGVPFLQKPFTPSALAAKVREVLDA